MLRGLFSFLQILVAFSSNEIRQLGKRLRDGGEDADDIGMLEQFRDSFDDLLIEKSCDLDRLFRGAEVDVLVSGRSKRTKSIIRKLKRPGNHGMDLSRMSDLVGLRAIFRSLADQNRGLEIIQSGLEVKGAVSDYRNRESGYRSIHAIVRNEQQLLEIQLRTLPQHLWAVESESFGEQAKEGTVTPEQRDYLSALSVASIGLDAGQNVTIDPGAGAVLFQKRSPLEWMLPNLQKKFDETVLRDRRGNTGDTTIVVFDNKLGHLLHKFHFPVASRSEALGRYRKLAHSLSSERFELLIFNSASDDVLAVTHPRFFIY